ncbi:ABC transporter permease [Nonomuraea turkmeniaca]|uniref:ABC transporter permease n=1 Tax=Nonomuraea turkmeniaca TaxID=103838 RepID=A0A5S4FJV1_9ACTN|nr:ABC transporter permease [Nonomuraea turkmeniaca]TMR20491.1 ABC transporter permease [Nonomuraea turkmeniaca]
MDRPLSAVWAAAQGGVRRRKLQTVGIAVVVALSTATLVFGLGLLAASNSMFDDAFEEARGAHATVFFDSTKTTTGEVAATAQAAGVTAAAGPFQTAALTEALVSGEMPIRGGDLVVAGRAGSGGPMDRLTVTSGRWVRAPGEIVLRGSAFGPVRLGATLTSPGHPPLTIVGFATSITDGANGWVTPGQIGALRPTGLQMLYRFARAADSPQVRQSLSAATAGLPVLSYDSYLTAEQEFEREFNELIPFITVFGVFAMALSVFIIGNVVSGAVIAGFRHIGVMKALGFTPAQVSAVYIVMSVVPALLGCAAGLAAGHLLATGVAESMAAGFELPSVGGPSLLLDAVGGGGVIALVVLAALVPALRAGRLPAARAISAGTVSGRGRGRRVQRWLARTGLPAPVALGLSLPVGRPARTVLTFAGLCVGVTAVTMGFGLYRSVMENATADPEGHTSVSVRVDPAADGRARLSEQQVFALLRAQPGTAHVMSYDNQPVTIPGLPSGFQIETFTGDYGPFLGDNLVRGRWFTRPGELVPSEAFLRLHHLDVGDTVSLQLNGDQTTVRIVGSFAHQDPGRLMLDAASVSGPPRPIERRPISVIVTPGTDPAEYADRLNAAAASDGVVAGVTVPETGHVADEMSMFLLFLLIITTTAAFGVLNSVVLSARERSRDLGVLKAIGMSPRQVILMMVTSMAALGVLGAVIGVPLGVLTHHGVAVLAGELLGSGTPAAWIYVYSWPLLAVPAGAGLLIAVLGAWLPAGWAAATHTAGVLRSE